MKTILVTGGAGFIGSHFVDLLVDETDYLIIVFDKLTYAGKLENMGSFMKSKRVNFVKGDICDSDLVNSIFKMFDIDYVVNFAAESHVDNSIINPDAFIKTNVVGTQILLDIAKKYWKNEREWRQGVKFIQISTDEVYGMLGDSGSFLETNCLNPSSPYSASKAAADLLCLSYFNTYGFPLLITRSSNNYGPRQDYEKLIPKVVLNALNDQKIPLYGNGGNVRDWIFVKDNCNAILKLLNKSMIGEIYNIGGDNEKTNFELILYILNILNKPTSLIYYVKDRLGHDYRYSVDSSKTRLLIGNYLLTSFESGMLKTIAYFRV